MAVWPHRQSMAENIWKEEFVRVSSFQRAAASLILIGSFGLTGCSATPNWANPVAWYDGVVGNDQGLPEKLPEGPDKDFPELAEVGEAPKPTLTVKERKNITEGLIADRDRQAYTGEILQGGTDASAPPPPAAAPSTFVGQPASPKNPESEEATDDTEGQEERKGFFRRLF